MPSTSCFCGFDIAGDDRDAQVATGLAHFTEAHPQLGLTEVNIRSYCERVEQLSGATERLESIGDVSVVPITADRIDDVLAFFDADAFADNPAWASCYCVCHHVDGATWSQRSWQQNRADLPELIRSGRLTGTLAYVDGKVAAWLNASPRSSYPEHVTGSADDATTGHVECFVVAPPYRGHGIARSLLAEALGVLRDGGCTAVEGHPVAEPRDTGAKYHGTVPLFEGAGFEVGEVVGTRVEVRRAL